MRPPFAALLFLLTALGAAPALHAEMCSGDYQSGARRVTKAEREKWEAAQRSEREREAQAEAARLARKAALRQAEARRRASIPVGARLIEDRCTVCHSPDTLVHQRHGWLGWWTIVIRMEFFNGAQLAPGERGPIVEHLATHQAGSRGQVALEWAGVALAPGTLFVVFGHRFLRRRRSSAR